MALDIQLPLQYDNPKRSVTVTQAVNAFVIVPAYRPQVMDVIAGEAALPDESVVGQRVFVGGCRIIDCTAYSSDAAAKSILLSVGTQTSINAAASTIVGVTPMTSLIITTQNTLTRGAGSYITDGWKIGDIAMIFDATTAANNGVTAIVTGVTGTALTTNGIVWANETVSANAGLYRVARKCQVSIPANSGNTDLIPNVKLLNAVTDNSTDALGLYMSPNEVLIGTMTANISALPALVSVSAVAARL